MKNKHLLMIGLMLISGCSLSFAQPKANGTPKLLVKSKSLLSSPVWSPDGSKLALTSLKNTGIWTVDSDGKNLRQVTDDLGAGYKMTWADDNVTILSRPYTIENNRKYTSVKTYNTEARTEKVLVAQTRRIKGTPSFSADNSQVEYQLDGKMTTSTTGLKPISKLKSAPMGESLFKKMVSDPANVTSTTPALKQFAGRTLMNPALSPSGEKIAFQIPGEGLFVCNADGSGIKNLGYGEDPSWTSDSKYVIVSKSKDDGNNITSSELSSININTGEQYSLLASDSLIPLKANISPDGKKVAFEDYATGSIYVMNLKY